jgi:hypothetical protein
MAKYSMKKGGKEVGSAAVYAEPHTMTGKKVKAVQDSSSLKLDELNPSAGNVTKGNFKPTKTSGIKIRGTGAATKGVMARGPMA